LAIAIMQVEMVSTVVVAEGILREVKNMILLSWGRTTVSKKIISKSFYVLIYFTFLRLFDLFRSYSLLKL